MEKLLVSACLLGIPCRYDGSRKQCGAVRALAGQWELVPVCPEELGGLACPREPAEQRVTAAGERRVISRDGTDVTDAFERGARAVLKIARENGCAAAVLKERSPSCGFGEIYDGTFSGKRIKGNGVCAALLSAHGILVTGETHLELLSHS